MIRSAYLVVVVLTIELVSGNPKKYEGFTYLGPVPSGSAKSSRAPTDYYLSDEPASWLNAYTACNNLLGILASPINPVLDNALRTYMVQSSATDVPIWLGATREIDAKWIWMTKNMNVQWSNFFPTGCSTMNVKGGLTAMYTTNNGWGWCAQSYSRTTNRYVCEF